MANIGSLLGGIYEGGRQTAQSILASIPMERQWRLMQAEERMAELLRNYRPPKEPLQRIVWGMRRLGTPEEEIQGVVGELKKEPQNIEKFYETQVKPELQRRGLLDVTPEQIAKTYLYSGDPRYAMEGLNALLSLKSQRDIEQYRKAQIEQSQKRYELDKTIRGIELFSRYLDMVAKNPTLAPTITPIIRNKLEKFGVKIYPGFEEDMQKLGSLPDENRKRVKDALKRYQKAVKEGDEIGMIDSVVDLIGYAKDAELPLNWLKSLTDQIPTKEARAQIYELLKSASEEQRREAEKKYFVETGKFLQGKTDIAQKDDGSWWFVERDPLNPSVITQWIRPLTPEEMAQQVEKPVKPILEVSKVDGEYWLVARDPYTLKIVRKVRRANPAEIHKAEDLRNFKDLMFRLTMKAIETGKVDKELLDKIAQYNMIFASPLGQALVATAQALRNDIMLQFAKPEDRPKIIMDRFYSIFAIPDVIKQIGVTKKSVKGSLPFYTPEPQGKEQKKPTKSWKDSIKEWIDYIGHFLWGTSPEEHTTPKEEQKQPSPGSATDELINKYLNE